MFHFLHILVNTSWNHSNANVILQTTYSHIPNKQLDDANYREVVTSLSTKDDPLKMVKQL